MGKIILHCKIYFIKIKNETEGMGGKDGLCIQKWTDLLNTLKTHTFIKRKGLNTEQVVAIYTLLCSLPKKHKSLELNQANLYLKNTHIYNALTEIKDHSPHYYSTTKKRSLSFLHSPPSGSMKSPLENC